MKTYAVVNTLMALVLFGCCGNDGGNAEREPEPVAYHVTAYGMTGELVGEWDAISVYHYTGGEWAVYLPTGGKVLLQAPAVVSTPVVRK